MRLMGTNILKVVCHTKARETLTSTDLTQRHFQFARLQDGPQYGQGDYTNESGMDEMALN